MLFVGSVSFLIVELFLNQFGPILLEERSSIQMAGLVGLWRYRACTIESIIPLTEKL